MNNWDKSNKSNYRFCMGRLYERINFVGLKNNKGKWDIGKNKACKIKQQILQYLSRFRESLLLILIGAFLALIL